MIIINIDVFNDHLLVSLEGSILSYDVLNIYLLNTLNKLAPIRKLKVSYHPQTPWFSMNWGIWKENFEDLKNSLEKQSLKNIMISSLNSV